MSLIHGFEPISAPDATRLILGSMPSVASLTMGRYYAHPRNAFWPIISALFAPEGVERIAYQQGIALLKTDKIALWDVLRSCRREGSLDADIEASSIVANDFPAFFARHRALRAVYFNGARAESAYRRHVTPRLGASPPPLRYRRLPSTSPAHAALSLAQKREAWRALTEPV